jgi:bacteriocin biosynthesis cyclodehydratase domain-containing protein
VTTSLSPRMRLRPGAAVFEISAEHLQILLPNHTATFNGAAVVKGLHAILRVLDPAAQRHEVHERLAAEAFAPQFLDWLLDLLKNSHCLAFDNEEADIPAGHEALAQFYSSLGADFTTIFAQLRNTRVIVVTPFAGSPEVTAVLCAAGFEAEVVAIDTETTTAGALAMVERRFGPGPATLASWGFPYRLPFARRLNDFALERGSQLLFGGIEGAVGRIGPLVIPGASACLECAVRRLLSHAGPPELQATVAYRARNEDRVPAPWPSHPLFHDALLRFFVLELIQVVRVLPPRSFGGLIEYSLSDGQVERRPVYRVPRCPACSGSRPERVAWDAQFPAPSVKGGDG